jgi:hypothetical protein
MLGYIRWTRSALVARVLAVLNLSFVLKKKGDLPGTIPEEGNSSTFPTTQIHDGVMNVINERPFSKVVVAFVVVMTAVGVVSMVVTIIRCFDTNKFNDSVCILLWTGAKMLGVPTISPLP